MKRVPNESLDYADGHMYLHGDPFTGVGYSLDEEGRLEGEITYREGLKWGLKRGWFDTGALSHESPIFLGVLHGKKREWHRNGQLSEEGDYELGFALRRKRWDEDGKLIEEYELKETDANYKELQKYQEIYKDDLETEKRERPAN